MFLLGVGLLPAQPTAAAPWHGLVREDGRCPEGLTEQVILWIVGSRRLFVRAVKQLRNSLAKAKPPLFNCAPGAFYWLYKDSKRNPSVSEPIFNLTMDCSGFSSYKSCSHASFALAARDWCYSRGGDQVTKATVPGAAPGVEQCK